MKKLIFLGFFILLVVNISAQSRLYIPVSNLENQSYSRINKNVWPDDVRNNFENYTQTLTGWVGIVEKYMTDFSNTEYNVLGLYVKHHYYNWIEDFGLNNKPIQLSPDGEGYFICYYLFIKDFDATEMITNIVGDCIINYGYPIQMDDDVIILNSEYIRFISKEYVNPNWINYGRNGFGDIIR